MLRIGEFSRLGQVSVRMLRHYDALGLLKPAEINNLTGYRSYSIDQLSRLNRILALRYLGFSLDQVARLLATDLPATDLRGMLTLRRAELARQLDEDQARLARVEARLRQIETEDDPSPYDVIVKDIASRTIASRRMTVPTLSDMRNYRCALYDDLYDLLTRNRIKPESPEFALYHDLEHLEQDIDTEVAVAIVDGVGTPVVAGADRLILRELPAVPAMASVIHNGCAWDIPHAIGALYAWVGMNDRVPAGPYRELHLSGRENDQVRWDPANLGSVVIELQLPLATETPRDRQTALSHAT